jgi:Ferritin-like
MNLKIVTLMRSPTHDLGWLQEALQSAIELELATLPPYLCGYWALQDSDSYPATQIHSIVMQEMLHFGLACNMLTATGKQPEVLKGYATIEYPGPLPGGVVPQCVQDLVPCDPNFEVVLGFPNFKTFALMCCQIEYPEDPVPEALRRATEIFTSIGKFYDAILDAFRRNDAKIPYQLANQQQRSLGMFTIGNLADATKAIQLIQQQGEGGSRYPYYSPGQLSHFYAFGELYYMTKYEFDPATQRGGWTGDKISIPDGQVYNMTPVPLHGYPLPPPEVTECDRLFTAVLTHLEAAWSGGGAAQLSAAIASMAALGGQATALLAKRRNRTDAPGIYGPQFKIVAAGGGTSGGGVSTGGGSTTMAVSFAKDVLPLFRTIDVDHMKPLGVVLDDYAYMSDATDDHANAKAVLDVLKKHRMPPGGPFWTQAQLDLFSKWMSDGYKE